MISRQAIPIQFNMSLDVKGYYKFIKDYDEWIHSSKQLVKGLPGKPCVVSGITDAFNQLYGIYNKIGVFDGEYGYHDLVLGDRVTRDLDEADCIVISHPFSADGNSSEALLHAADAYNKPIFVDCAFFGICDNISFDFTAFENVHSVCFSLSKCMGTGLHRVGLLYSKDNFPAKIYDEWMYPLMSQVLQHQKFCLINEISPDDMFARYREKQLQICTELEVKPSDTVIFGYDYSDKYKEYQRGPVNRLCLSALLNSQVKDVLNDMDRMGQVN